MAQGFVAPTAPLVDPKTGIIARPWFEFFRTLYIRTGGATGIVDGGGFGGGAAGDLDAASAALYAALIEDGPGGQTSDPMLPFLFEPIERDAPDPLVGLIFGMDA